MIKISVYKTYTNNMIKRNTVGHSKHESLLEPHESHVEHQLSGRLQSVLGICWRRLRFQQAFSFGRGRKIGHEGSSEW